MSASKRLREGGVTEDAIDLVRDDEEPVSQRERVDENKAKGNDDPEHAADNFADKTARSKKPATKPTTIPYAR
jgi:hypothetical protein